MNIVALSLGLAPIPPRPAAAPVRAHRIHDERVTPVRRTRQPPTAWRAEMLQRLCDDGHVMCRKLGRGHLWYLPEHGDA